MELFGEVSIHFKPDRIPRGSVVKCSTRNPGVLGSSRTGSSGLFRGSVLGQDTSKPRPVWWTDQFSRG